MGSFCENGSDNFQVMCWNYYKQWLFDFSRQVCFTALQRKNVENDKMILLYIVLETRFSKKYVCIIKSSRLKYPRTTLRVRLNNTRVFFEKRVFKTKSIRWIIHLWYALSHTLSIYIIRIGAMYGLPFLTL